MKSTIKKDARLGTNMCSFKGAVDISYADLVRVFGEPNRGESADQKVLVEWVLRTPVGVATIYNYKSGVNWTARGLEAKDIYDWHIGGRSADVADVLIAHLRSVGAKFTVPVPAWV